MRRTIGLVYDPHIVAGGRRANDGVEVSKRAIDVLNDVGVDWTLLGGDLRSFTAPFPRDTAPYDGWGDWLGDPDNYYFREDYELLRRLYDRRLDSEYFVIRGNNDRPLSVFREFFPASAHPLWYWFEDAGARYVFLDSNPQDGAHILAERANFVTAPQLSMLERLMDDDPDIPTFVFCHAPLAKHPEIRTDWETGRMSAQFITLNHLSVQHILERGTTVIVNTGHYYGGEGRGTQRIEGVHYVNARHLSKGGSPDYAGDVRWMTVDTDAREAAVSYHDIGEDERGVITNASW